MVGDRGSVTSVRIRQLKALPGAGWITALRAPQVAALARDDGPLQMSLFDEQNFAEITDARYPGERLICCRNPALEALFECHLTAAGGPGADSGPGSPGRRHRPEPPYRRHPVARTARASAAGRRAGAGSTQAGRAAAVRRVRLCARRQVRRRRG